jgi:ABC-type transport system substrate-binding protein
VGTGPFIFKFEEYKPDEAIVLEKNPHYFKKGLPYLDLTEMYPYNPDKAKALLKEAGYDANHPLVFELMTNNDDQQQGADAARP